jgi:hypothetical protein
MSAKLVGVWHVSAVGSFLPLIPKVRPRLDHPPLGVQFPKRAPLFMRPKGHFNPGARWLKFPADGPWFKKPRSVRLDRSNPILAE